MELCVCMACVLEMMFLLVAKSIIHRNRNVLSSVSTNHDQISICVLSGLALVLRDSAGLQWST